MNFLFLVPDPNAFVSGGNLYNQQLMEALQAAGEQVKRTEEGDEVWAESPDVSWLDTLYLRDFPWERWRHKPQGKLGIIFHHLPCLELPFASQAQKEAFAPDRQFFELAELILCTSDFSARFFVEMGIETEKLLVIPPANELHVSHQAPDPPPLQGLMVANLVPRKGVLPFLEALSDQGEEEDNFFIQIAGDDRLQPGYARACHQLVDAQPYLRSRVSFAGILPRKEIAEAYGRVHAFLSASSVESFGMALQEARAAGLPILAIGGKGRGGYGASFVVEGKNGLLANDPADLARHWLGWVRDQRGWEACFQQAQAVRPPADYDWGSAARKLLFFLGQDF